jgi:hypothetical protein
MPGSGRACPAYLVFGFGFGSRGSAFRAGQIATAVAHFVHG